MRLGLGLELELGAGPEPGLGLMSGSGTHMIDTEVISTRNQLVFEVGENECGFPDGADLVGAGGDVA